jgi:hypothetical protein
MASNKDGMKLCCPDCNGEIEVASYSGLLDGEILACKECALEVLLYKNEKGFYKALQEAEHPVSSEALTVKISSSTFGRNFGPLLRETVYVDSARSEIVGYKQDFKLLGVGPESSIYFLRAQKIKEEWGE